MNGLMTEGIPLGFPIQYITSGLGSGDEPPPEPPSPVPPTGAGLSDGISYVVVDNENGPFTSAYFVLPTGSTKITWSLEGTVTAADLEGSLDHVHFAVIDSASAAGIRSLFTNVPFFRIVITTGEGVTARIVAKREKL